VPGDTNHASDIFLFDALTSTAKLLTLATSGDPADGASTNPSVSADGRFVVFESTAGNLAPEDNNGLSDIYLHDTALNVTKLISTGWLGQQSNGQSTKPRLSSDGRYIIFTSSATNLVQTDTNSKDDVFICEVQTGTIILGSKSVTGLGANGHSNNGCLSADGRYAAFESLASNIALDDTNAVSDIFVFDVLLDTSVRVSVSTLGIQGNKSSTEPTISTTGQRVAFQSLATNLVSDDTNSSADIFVRDMDLSVIFRASVSTSGGQSNGDCSVPSISGDGQRISFQTYASNLVSGDNNGKTDVFVRDTAASQTWRVSLSTEGGQGNAPSEQGAISLDGQFIVFESGSTTLSNTDQTVWRDLYLRNIDSQVTAQVSFAGVPGMSNWFSGEPASSWDGRYVAFASAGSNFGVLDNNLVSDVYVRDTALGAVVLASLGETGTQELEECVEPSLSADGNMVVFRSKSSNLVANDTNNAYDIFLRILDQEFTARVSVSSGGVQGNNISMRPWISGDGKVVVYESMASNLVSGDTNSFRDIFWRDLELGVTRRVSVSSGGLQGNESSQSATCSFDGRYICFSSGASNLVSGDSNGASDVFVHDVVLGTTHRVSVGNDGGQGNAASYSDRISGNGRWVAFSSSASNLVDGDANGTRDVFIRDLLNQITIRVAPKGIDPNGTSRRAVISFDGRLVAFGSDASNLVSSNSNGCSDVFMYDQVAKSLRLISKSGAIAGNRQADYAAVSPNGKFVFFASEATNLSPLPKRTDSLEIFGHEVARRPTKL